MTRLATYDRKEGGRTLAPAMRTLWKTPKMAPGTFVEDMREPEGKRGFGTIVGLTDDEVAVLWSALPLALQRLDLGHNPLAVSEDILVSVRPLGEQAPPRTSEQVAEDVEYFRKNLFAALKLPPEMLR